MPVLLAAIIQNAGQTCSAGSRVLIQRGVYETVLKRLSEAFAATVTGPAAQDLDVGPLISARQHDRVRGFVAEAEAEGLKAAARGKLKDGASASGYYQVPVLFRDVPPNSRLAQEEVFGPVLPPWPSTPKRKRSRWPMARFTAWSPASGRATAPASCAWPASCAPVRSSSITTARAVGGTAVRRFAPVGLWPREGVRGAVWLHDLEDDCDQAPTRWRGFAAARAASVFVLGDTCADSSSACTRPVFSGEGCAICCDGMRAWLRADPGGFGGARMFHSIAEDCRAGAWILMWKDCMRRTLLWDLTAP